MFSYITLKFFFNDFGILALARTFFFKKRFGQNMSKKWSVLYEDGLSFFYFNFLARNALNKILLIFTSEDSYNICHGANEILYNNLLSYG